MESACFLRGSLSSITLPLFALLSLAQKEKNVPLYSYIFTMDLYINGARLQKSGH